MGIVESRRLAREVALFVIYCTKIKERFVIEECKKDVLNLIDEEELQLRELDEEGSKFLSNLLEAYEMHHDEAINLIRNHLERWDIGRMNALDVSIMELAICELIGISDVAYKVTISEAVNLAKKYSSNRAPFLINAVLDSISGTLGLRK